MYDLLIINAHRQYDAVPILEGDWLGVYLLAAFLEANMHPTRAFAGYVHEAVPLLEAQMALGVRVVGFACDYENQQEVVSLCRMVKERWGGPVIVGGPQAMALGRDFLLDSGADVCVRGEGELPLLALMHYFVDGTGTLEDIRGISFLQDGRLRRTADQECIKNLDALPFADPSLILGSWFRRNTASFLTARGCPFRCAFCYEGGNTRGVRWRSVGNVMQEVRQTLLARPDLRYILFTDDTFTLNVKRVSAFASELAALRQERDLGWFAEAHPATLLRHPSMVRDMVEAGLVTLQIGIESGDAAVLRAYNKKTTPSMIEETVQLCSEAGLPHMVGNIIVGGAWESEESLATSRDFALHLLHVGRGMLDLHTINFWPLPGTAMTSRPGDFGLEIVDAHSLTSVTDYPVVRCGSMTPERLSFLRADMGKALGIRKTELARQLCPQRAEMHFELARRYHIFTGWYKELSVLERCLRYSALLHSGAAKRMVDVPRDELFQWHPQRTCTPMACADGYYAGDILIEAEHYPVLVASAGRMNVQAAAEYCSKDVHAFLRSAQYLEDRMALVFCKL